MGVWMWTHITEKLKGLSQSNVQHAYTFSKELIKTVTEMLWRKTQTQLSIKRLCHADVDCASFFKVQTFYVSDKT